MFKKGVEILQYQGISHGAVKRGYVILNLVNPYMFNYEKARAFIQTPQGKNHR